MNKDPLMTIYNEWPIDQFMKFLTYIEICSAREQESYHNLEMQRKASQNK